MTKIRPPHGKSFDFDRVLGSVPDATESTEATADIVQSTEAVVAAGDLVRRARNRRHMTQELLANRAGTTQPHISDIERGLGSAGPSVGTLARLLKELNDELVLRTRKEQALWIAQRINDAEVAIGELAEQIERAGVTDMGTVMIELSKASKAELTNPFKNTLLNGLILGIYMALRALPEGSVSDAEKAALQLVKNTMAERRFSAILNREG